jgi:zinc/manganese transport system permease protein
MSLVELSILGPGFVAGLLVLATHVPMGREVLRRGIIFIDLAVAQTAGLGVIGAGALGWDPHGVAAQVAAFLAAIAAGVFLTWTERHWGEVQEAIIGALFVMAATGGILLLANHPKGGDELQDLLVGQILWVDMHVIWPALVVTAIVLLCWYRLRHRLGPMGFYLLFAVSVTVAVQLVGVYLVFASLIIPALATRSMSRIRGLAAAYGIGVAGYVLGLLGSALLDLPTGAVVVWTLAAVAVVWRFLLRLA